MNNYARVMVYHEWLYIYLSSYTIYRLRYMTGEMIDDVMMTSSIQIEGFIDEKSVTCDLLCFVTACLEFQLKNKQDIRQGDNLYQLVLFIYFLLEWYLYSMVRNNISAVGFEGTGFANRRYYRFNESLFMTSKTKSTNNVLKPYVRSDGIPET